MHRTSERVGAEQGMIRDRYGFALVAGLWALAMLLGTIAAPGAAHKDHQKKQETAAQISQSTGRSGGLGVPMSMPVDIPAPDADVGHLQHERSQKRTFERLLDWLGRLHPIIVHFPIAFFPAALFTAVVGRRRPAFAAPVQFLVIAGGVLGPLAALLGWFDGGFDMPGDDWLLRVHRWLGTAIGVGALGLAAFAWRRPEHNRGVGMIAALAVITVAIVVQGWFGGALVHGIDHMNW